MKEGDIKVRNAESIIKLKYKTKLREQWVVWDGRIKEVRERSGNVRGNDQKLLSQRIRISARSSGRECCVVVVVTGLWVRVWWLNDKKLYDLLWVKWRLDKVGFDCCCVYVYSVLYLASLLPVVTAIDCWYCFIVLASHVTFFHFFLLLLLSFLAFCSLAWSLCILGWLSVFLLIWVMSARLWNW